MDVLLWNEKQWSLFHDFLSTRWTFIILRPQTPFPKLEKHSPTNQYMRYPMLRIVEFFSVYIYMKYPLESHGDDPHIIHHRHPSLHRKSVTRAAAKFQSREPRLARNAVTPINNFSISIVLN
jgi:hypothetical protein